MNLEKDEVTIIGSIVGFCLLIFGGGRAYEKISNRVGALERQPPFVLLSSCEERRAGCNRENKLQFDAGERQFDELKKLIADNDRASNERHAEIMHILLKMNKQ